MDKQMMREWQARWELVAEKQAEEAQGMTMAERWQKFIAIQHMAAKMNLKRYVNEEEIDLVRSRWAYLRHRYEASR